MLAGLDIQSVVCIIWDRKFIASVVLAVSTCLP